MVRANHQVLIRNAAVKIFRRVVVHQIAQVPRVKHVMVRILEARVLLQWSAINLVCVHEFLNQIFQKM
jgi:hypothetical protein